jgi:hypothetical protein
MPSLGDAVRCNEGTIIAGLSGITINSCKILVGSGDGSDSNTYAYNLFHGMQ